MQGFQHYQAYLTQEQQTALLFDVLKVIKAAPLYYPTMPKSGRPFSVQETNCGTLGWISDKAGYRYQAHHPETGKPWPKMPNAFIKIWRALSSHPTLPQAGLINHYSDTAKMGLHQDKDEEDFSAPVVSISLGNTAKFRLGGLTRRGKTTTLDLQSGDVVVMAGESRLAYHGIDRIYQGTCSLLQSTPLLAGRINITLRRVKPIPK